MRAAGLWQWARRAPERGRVPRERSLALPNRQGRRQGSWGGAVAQLPSRQGWRGGLKVLRNPGCQSEAPPSLLAETLFTLDAVTRVHVTPRNYERPGGVEWVKADWGTGSQATRVFSAGPMPPEPERFPK